MSIQYSHKTQGMSRRELLQAGLAAGATLSLGFSALFNIGRELTGLGR